MFSCPASLCSQQYGSPASGQTPDSEEDDPELLLHVPFSGSVKLTGITVVGGPDGASPAKLKASRGGWGTVLGWGLRQGDNWTCCRPQPRCTTAWE